MVQYIGYLFFRAAIALVSQLSFKALYRLSDAFAFFLEKIIRYRKKVIFTNLKNAFPKKSNTEINAIAKGFYAHLADIVLESLKGNAIEPDALKPYYVFENSPILEEYYKKNQSLIVVCGHYANWEWGVMCGGLYLKYFSIGYYKPIKNKFIDRYFRQKFEGDHRNLIMVSKKEVPKTIEAYQNQNVLHLLVADQNPNSRTNAVWLNFLNQDTACLTGPEWLAKKFNYPVVFLAINRKKRGHYTFHFEPLIDNPSETAPEEITQKFMYRLEQQIIESPEKWLWSHKRWKKRRSS